VNVALHVELADAIERMHVALPAVGADVEDFAATFTPQDGDVVRHVLAVAELDRLTDARQQRARQELLRDLIHEGGLYRNWRLAGCGQQRDDRVLRYDASDFRDGGRRRLWSGRLRRGRRRVTAGNGHEYREGGNLNDLHIRMETRFAKLDGSMASARD
jgi:hypothetical protein